MLMNLPNNDENDDDDDDDDNDDDGGGHHHDNFDKLIKDSETTMNWERESQNLVPVGL